MDNDDKVERYYAEARQSMVDAGEDVRSLDNIMRASLIYSMCDRGDDRARVILSIARYLEGECSCGRTMTIPDGFSPHVCKCGETVLWDYTLRREPGEHTTRCLGCGDSHTGQVARLKASDITFEDPVDQMVHEALSTKYRGEA